MTRMRSILLFVALLPAVTVFACGAKPQSDAPPGDHARRAPPEEAFTACTGKTEGAECSVKRGDETVTGTCRKGPPDSSDSRLACMPQGGPGH